MSGNWIHLSRSSLQLGGALALLGLLIGVIRGEHLDLLSPTAILLCVVGAALVILGLPGVFLQGGTAIGRGGMIGYAGLFLFLLTFFGEQVTHLLTSGLAGVSGEAGLELFHAAGYLLALVGGVGLGTSLIARRPGISLAGLLLVLGSLHVVGGNYLDALWILEGIGVIALLAGHLWWATGAEVRGDPVDRPQGSVV